MSSPTRIGAVCLMLLSLAVINAADVFADGTAVTPTASRSITSATVPGPSIVSAPTYLAGQGSAARRQPVPNAGSKSDTSTLKLAAAVDLALRENPGLAQIESRVAALRAVPPQVGTLPDPILSLNALNLPTDSFDLTQEPTTQLQLGVSQVIPFPGKLDLRERAAAHEAEAGAHGYEEARLGLIRDVKLIWWRLYFLDRSIEIIARNQDLLREFVTVAQTKYKVGDGLQQDVLLAQLELSRLLDLDLQLKGARRVEQARLNALLNQPPDRSIRLPADVEQELPMVGDEQALFAVAETERPLLARQREQVNAATARQQLAKKDYYPDLRLGVSYGFRGGDNPDGSDRADFASVQASINVPIFARRKQDKALDQRTSELLQQNWTLQDQREQVQAEISTAVADYRRARDQASLFRTGIIPQARQTVASMLAGYQVNKVDFLNLVSAQVNLYNFETQYWKALTEAKRAHARIASAIGKETI